MKHYAFEYHLSVRFDAVSAVSDKSQHIVSSSSPLLSRQD